MAIHAPITAGAACAPGNVSDFAPSRRDLLRALGPAVIATIPVSAMASHTAGPVDVPASIERARWDQLVTVFRRERDRAEAHRANVMRPLEAELLKLAPAPVDTFVVTAANGQQATYKLRPDALDQYDGFPAFEKHANPLKAAVRAYPAHRRATLAMLQFDAHCDEEDRLDNLWFEAENTLLMTPAPDAQALATKILILLSDGRDAIPDGQQAVLLSDAQRLGGSK